jgi:hypothetical protein
MVSAVTSAAFGVPFALAVLQRLSINQAARFDRLAVRRLAARAGEELVAAAVAVIGEDPDANGKLLENRHKVAATIRRAMADMGTLAEAVHQADELTGLTHVDERCLVPAEDVERIVDALDAATRAWRSALGEESDLLSRVLQAKSRWEFLIGPVRTRILESGFAWLDASIIEDCGRSLVEIERALPAACLPAVAGRTKDDFASYSPSRLEIWNYSRPAERPEVVLPYDFVVDMPNRFEPSLRLYFQFEKFSEKCEKISTLLTALAGPA